MSWWNREGRSSCRYMCQANWLNAAWPGMAVVAIDPSSTETIAVYIDANMSALHSTLEAAAHHALMYGNGSTMPPNYIIEEPEPKEQFYEQPIPSWLKFATRKADRTLGSGTSTHGR